MRLVVVIGDAAARLATGQHRTGAPFSAAKLVAGHADQVSVCWQN